VFEGLGLFLLGMLQVVLLFVLLRPLEAWRPVERWTDRQPVHVDLLYTLLFRTGALTLLFFLLLYPVLSPVENALHGAGLLPRNLEEWVPGLSRSPLLAFVAYLVVIDFFEYWRHRLQHKLGWWWSLHSIHHSQRQMTFWTEDRNHVLDGLIEAMWIAVLAFTIGVQGEQFLLLVLTFKAVENFSHANVRMHFGAIGDRLLVSPRFHRVHHGIGMGHEGPARGCNFAALFPVWDILFGTANFQRELPPTGIRDQLTGADYGRGFWDQQVAGLKRMAAALRPERAHG